MDNYYNDDDFTKKLIVKYLIGLSKNSFLLDYLDTDFVENILKLFSINKHYFEYYIKIQCRQCMSKKSQFINKLLEEIQKKCRTLKNKPSLLEKKIKIISKIYMLDSIEYEILLFIVMQNISPIIKSFNDELGNINSRSKKLYLFVEKVLHLSEWQLEIRINSLIRKGLLAARIDNSNPKCKAKIFEILANPKIKTEKQIRQAFLGKNQKSNLVWRDFEHLASEREIALNILLSALKNNTKGINILLYGFVGTGKTQLAKLIANKVKVEQYAVATETFGSDASREERLSDLASKQTILSSTGNACILFDEAEDVMNRGFSDQGKASKAYLNQLLEETPIPVFWTTNNILDVDPAFLRRMTYTIEFEKLTEDIRLNIWKRVIRKNKLKLDNKKLVELNKKYEIAPSIIANAVKTTKLINGTQNDFEMFVENLARVVAKKKNVKKKKEYEMKDYDCNLINTDFDMKNLTGKIKSSGKLNFSLCLYGEPGTGKSLYARYLASELGIEVILKRASDLISKYVGETEENIAEAFAEARAKKAMLIFDEADSFLQNRSNAERSWEISQVNEMLTWMESHEYPFVCTTNLMASLDEASLRRFTFKIKFDFMTKEQANCAFEHFFGIKNVNLNLRGLTAGDFATVKKKADFLGINNIQELTTMLAEEVKMKNSKELQNSIGF